MKSTLIPNRTKKLANPINPREKLLLFGTETLTNAELLAILLGNGTKEENVNILANKIMAKCSHNLLELGKMNLQEFKKFKGIGEVKAILIVAALELGKRRLQTSALERAKVTNSKEAYDLLHYDMAHLRTEVFRILLLNRNNRVIKIVEISKGGISGTMVDPKVIFKSAIDHEASSIILSHNHPSGNLEPSKADRNITKQIKKSGDLLDINVLDHVIVSEKGYFSFKDEGLL